MSSPEQWLHFVGVGGSGMSGLARFHAGRGGRATGSDRAFDLDQRPGARAELVAAGVTVVPQDGRGVDAGCAAVVVSTAVEDTIADVARARELGVPIWHRSELLARFVAEHRTIAVTGTSGKSTVTAMIFAILRGCGRDPRLLSGGEAVEIGANAWSGDLAAPTGRAPWLVIEADESDGSLVNYHPWAGVVLNLQRDHKEPAEVAAMFATFRSHLQGPLILGEEANLDPLRSGAVTFGLGPRADVRAEDVWLGPRGVRFRIGATPVDVPWPGRHTVLNATAAIAAAGAIGIPADAAAGPLARFAGVARRFQSLGKPRGIEVIDDFAHNPDKLRAAIAAARDRLGASAGRILAVFQPHGFGPTRFLWTDLVRAFGEALGPDDVLWLLEIFYAGGSAVRDVSAADLAREIADGGRDARFAPDRAGLVAAIATEARPDDVVLVMGARDPSLTEFGRTLVARLAAQAG